MKKRILMVLAGLAMVVGLAGTAEAGAQSAPAKSAVSASASTTAQTTKAATAVATSTSTAVNTHTVGCNYWYSWHYLGNIWVDSYYCGPAYSYPWYPYYRIYDNFKVCTDTGASCIAANSWTWQYYLYYYPLHTWYWYGPSGYSTSHETVGYGPYAG